MRNHRTGVCWVVGVAVKIIRPRYYLGWALDFKFYRKPLLNSSDINWRNQRKSSANFYQIIHSTVVFCACFRIVRLKAFKLFLLPTWSTLVAILDVNLNLEVEIFKLCCMNVLLKHDYCFRKMCDMFCRTCSTNGYIFLLFTWKHNMYRTTTNFS